MNGRNFSTGIPGVDFLITFLQGRVQRARSGERN